MPSRTLSFERGGQKRLALSWLGDWEDLNIALDGSILGSLPKFQMTHGGQTYKLTDGSTLNVRRIANFWELNRTEILSDGKPVPGSDTDPWKILNSTATLIIAFGSLCILVGLISVIFDNHQWMVEISTGCELILLGIIMLPLGYYTKRGSAIALILSMILIIIITIILPIMTGDSLKSSYIITCVSLLILLLLAIKYTPKSQQ